MTPSENSWLARVAAQHPSAYRHMKLTAEQQAAVDAFADVYHERRRTLKIGGLAGTGKTTIIRSILDTYGGEDIAVCAPTGKAAHVLRSKGVEACTLHSLLYRPSSRRKLNGDEEVSFYLLKGKPCRVLIVDEASMLSQKLVDDISRKVKHVVYVGDHGQLEPVGDDPGLMSSLDVRLEQIHRQAEDSPIIQFAQHVRTGGLPQTFRQEVFDPSILVQRGGGSDLADFDVVLCGFNKTRVEVNAWVRRRRGHWGELPQVGEQVICLRNDKEAQVWNGMTATVTEISSHHMSVETDDGPRNDLLIDPKQFGALKTLPYRRPRSGYATPTLWDFGYCITAHRAQGSEWPRVAVKEEIWEAKWDANRWRYTAATRASEELRWVL